MQAKSNRSVKVSLCIFGEFVSVGDWHRSAEEDHTAVSEQPVQEHLSGVVVVRFRLLQLPDLCQPATGNEESQFSSELNLET